MNSYRLSLAADADLIRIAEHGTEHFGETAALAYLDRLHDTLQRIADMPGIARPCDRIRIGYCRFEEGSHVFLMKQDAQGVLVVRILHKSQLPELHLLPDNEQE